MKKLIELLDRYEEIRDEMGAIGCIDGLSCVNQFGLGKLVEIIKDYDLGFTIGKFSKRYPHIIKVVVGDHVLFAVSDHAEYGEYFDEEGNLK